MGHLYVSPVQNGDDLSGNAAVLMTHHEVQGYPGDSYAD